MKAAKRSLVLRSVQWSAFAVLIACALAGGGLLLVTHGGLVQKVSMSIAQWRPAFILLHCVFIFGLWWKWEALARWVAARKRLSESHLATLYGLRGQIVVMLVILEIVAVIRPQSWL